MHTCAFSIPGGHRGIWCLEEPVQGTMPSSPVSAPLGPQGQNPSCGLQLLSAPSESLSLVLPPHLAEQITPSLCLLPHAPLARTRTLRALGHHRGTLTWSSGPDFSSGRRTFPMRRSAGSCGVIPLPFHLIPAWGWSPSSTLIDFLPCN